MPKLKVALLSEFPMELAEGLQVDYARGGRKGAFMTVEGYLIKSLMSHPDVLLDVVTFTKAVASPVVHRLGPHAVVHLLPAKRGTGMPFGWVPRVIIARRYLQRLRPDIVHGVRMLGGFAFMAVLSGFPHLITLQELLSKIDPPLRYKPFYWVGRQVERWTIRNARYMTVVSKHVQRAVEQETEATIYRVPNFVGDTFYKVQKVVSGPEVVCIGRISPEKGVLDMLKAAAILEREGIRARWRIIGGPTGHEGDAYLSTCKQFVKDHLQNQKVEFLGWLPNEAICDVLLTATCSVVPSQAPYETFCISMAEAMATGTPPIAYDFGPLPEHIDDGVSGYLVPAGDITLMAKRLRELLTNPAQTAEMGAAARRRAMAYKQEVVIDNLLRAYKEILVREKGVAVASV